MTDNRTTELRETAEGIDWEIPEAAELLREAADTIESLRDRLQNQAFALGMQEALGSGTCEVQHVKSGAMYDVWRYTCCGYEHAESVSEEAIPQNFCPKCGKRVSA